MTNYRSSFSRLARNKGLEGLIEELTVMNDAREAALEARDTKASDASRLSLSVDEAGAVGQKEELNELIEWRG